MPKESSASIQAQILGMSFMKGAVFSKDGTEWHIPSKEERTSISMTRKQLKNRAKARLARKAARKQKKRR